MFQMMKFASLLFQIERGLNSKVFIACDGSNLSMVCVSAPYTAIRNADSRIFCLLSGTGEDGNICFIILT